MQSSLNPYETHLFIPHSRQTGPLGPLGGGPQGTLASKFVPFRSRASKIGQFLTIIIFKISLRRVSRLAPKSSLWFNFLKECACGGLFVDSSLVLKSIFLVNFAAMVPKKSPLGPEL